MSKGKFSGAPNNMNNMMKQVQKMQRDLEKAQSELESKIYEVSAGGGAVKVSVNGRKEFLSINIDKALMESLDVEMLQDLVLIAVNDAVGQVENESSKVMGKMTGGMNIPGLF
mgnify:CR=1 FL=1